MDGRFLLLSTAVDPGLLISVMSPSLKQGCAALVSSHSAAGGSLGGLELIWTQPACIQDALGMQGRLRAGCKGGEAGNHIPGRGVAQSLSSPSMCRRKRGWHEAALVFVE